MGFLPLKLEKCKIWGVERLEKCYRLAVFC